MGGDNPEGFLEEAKPKLRLKGWTRADQAKGRESISSMEYTVCNGSETREKMANSRNQEWPKKKKKKSHNQNSPKGLISSGGSRARLPKLEFSPATYKLCDLSQGTYLSYASVSLSSILICSGCYNRRPHTVWLVNHRKLLLTILEPGSPRSRSKEIQCLVNPLPGSDTASSCHLT